MKNNTSVVLIPWWYLYRDDYPNYSTLNVIDVAGMTVRQEWDEHFQRTWVIEDER